MIQVDNNCTFAMSIIKYRKIEINVSDVSEKKVPQTYKSTEKLESSTLKGENKEMKEICNVILIYFGKRMHQLYLFSIFINGRVIQTN